MIKFLGIYWDRNEFIVPLFIRLSIILLCCLMALLFMPFLIFVYIFVVFGLSAYLFYINYFRGNYDK